MAMRYPGGFISSTAPTVNANTAKGVWTLEEAMQYIRAGQWPVPTGNGDPYFQYNTMLLPGQGTNGANNNTFLDSSTNNFTITRNGNTTQGTFTPFSQADGYWGAYFDGSGDYVDVASGASISGTGDFTVEAWIYPSQFNAGVAIVQANTTSGALTGILINSTGTIGMGRAGIDVQASSSFAVALNAWSHVAVTRQSGTVKIFINGVQSYSGTITTSYNAGTVRFGIESDGSSNPFKGFISNYRSVSGSALYTSNFTPSTSPLSTVSGITLLTFQSNRFVDKSSNAYAVTPSGNTAVTPFQPFGAPTVAYSASTIGGSGYFDGTGDYLTATANNAFNFGTGDFTVEGWIYPVAAGTMGIWANGPASAGSFGVAINSSGKLQMDYYGGTSLGGATNVPVNAWSYFAFVRTGSTLNIYLNGVRDATTTTSSNNSTNDFALGLGWTNVTTGGTNGYISGFRISDAFARYTGTTMTVPTAPTVNDGNTTVLCNFTNAGIIDNAQDNNLETVNNAQISTSQYKWGASSMYFDGTGDYLTAPANSIFAFGTGDFTVECWVYLSSSKAQVILDTRNSAGSTTGMAVAINSSNNPYVYLNNTTILTSSTVLSLSTWTHLAFVKTAGVVSIFVNGNQAGSVASSVSLTDITPTIATAIDYRDTSSTYHFHGYINDLRVTKGFCRYPYNFTAPTAAFPLFWQAAATPSADPYFEYTTLLLPGNGTNGAQNNTFLDSSTNNFSITRNGNTTQGTFTPFSQTGWGNYFSATGDNLRTGVMTPLGSGDFTLECWINPSSFANYRLIWDNRTSDPDANGFAFGLESSGKVYLYTNGGFALTTSGVVVANAWTHVALVRSATGSGNIKIYINGIADSTTGTNTANFSRTQAYVGNDLDGTGNPFVGYISNMRATTGALYTSNFTPSTSPLTTTVSAGTCVLLTCQSNRFVDNSASAVSITVAGASVQAFSPFNPTAAYSTSTVGGSGYFDGSLDYLTYSPSTSNQFGTGSFTVEAWYYPLSAPTAAGAAYIYDARTASVLSTWILGCRLNGTGVGNLLGWFNGSATLEGSALTVNAWNHIVYVRNSGTNTGSLFLNGTRTATQTDTTNYSSTGATATIGSRYNNTDFLNGYLQDLRIVKGTAVYDASATSITIPTAPLTAITNTSLLTNFTNGGITDATAKNDLETVGGASISTTVSKFGGSSMYFDGSGDYMDVLAANQLSNFSSGDWTIEAWIYRSTASANHCILNFINSAGTNAGLTFQVSSSNQLVSDNGTVAALAAGTVPSNQWVHIAIARYSGTTTGYINGVAVGTTTQAPSASQYLRIGALGNGGYAYHGYINDLRVTKGIARYTQNFTPPTSAFLTL